jgi:hypothetical protein
MNAIPTVIFSESVMRNPIHFVPHQLVRIIHDLWDANSYCNSHVWWRIDYTTICCWYHFIPTDCHWLADNVDHLYRDHRYSKMHQGIQLQMINYTRWTNSLSQPTKYNLHFIIQSWIISHCAFVRVTIWF